MEDYKARAAGERPNENDVTEKPKSTQEKRLELAEQALDFLLTFTQGRLNGEERKQWIARLSTVPSWKMKRLADFSSGYMRDIWKFFDELKQPPETYQPLALPEPERAGIAQDVLAHVKKILGPGSKEQKDKWERDGIAVLRKKHPHLKWWCGRGGNRDF